MFSFLCFFSLDHQHAVNVAIIRNMAKDNVLDWITSPSVMFSQLQMTNTQLCFNYVIYQVAVKFCHKHQWQYIHFSILYVVFQSALLSTLMTVVETFSISPHYFLSFPVPFLSNLPSQVRGAQKSGEFLQSVSIDMCEW